MCMYICIYIRTYIGYTHAYIEIRFCVCVCVSVYACLLCTGGIRVRVCIHICTCNRSDSLDASLTQKDGK